MARKNPFANLVEDDKAANRVVVDYTTKGASRSLLNSLDEMAARADRLEEGETIVELEPDLVDASFVRDRRADDEREFGELLDAIRAGGQNSPILVRPHPTSLGRYMVVFGHRRLRVAKELGRKVRAVVKKMGDREHVLALGQENSARANVPFIERAHFAADLARLRYDEDNATILSALSVDRTTLSKMLAVASLPLPILNAIGPARSVGRDRWYELKQLLEKPASQARAMEIIDEELFASLQSEDRFNQLIRRLKSRSSPRRLEATKHTWIPKDSSLSADIATDGKRFTLALKAKGTDARAFGEFLSENLDQLYEAFRNTGLKSDGG